MNKETKIYIGIIIFVLLLFWVPSVFKGIKLEIKEALAKEDFAKNKEKLARALDVYKSIQARMKIDSEERLYIDKIVNSLKLVKAKKLTGERISIILDFLSGSSFVVDKESRTEIEFWHAMGGPLGRVLHDLVDRFNSSQSKYYIKDEHMGNYRALSQKMIAAVAAGNPPDMGQAYESWTSIFIKAGSIISLEKYAREKDFHLEDFYPVMLENNRFDNVLYSLPFNKSMPVIYYNKEHFKNAGLNGPPETWEDFEKYVKALTIDKNKDGVPEIFGTAFPAASWNFECMVLQNGGEIISKDGKKVLFNSKEGVKSLQFLMDLLKNKYAYRTTGYDHQNDFIAGKNSMIIGSVVSNLFMRPKINFDYGMAPLPMGTIIDEKTKEKTYKKASIMSGTNIVIFKKGDVKKYKGAWEFLKFLVNPENTAYWSIRTTYMPVRKSALNSKYMKQKIKEDPNLLAGPVQLPYAKFEPRFKEWFDCRKLLDESLEKAAVNCEDKAKKYLDEACAKINAILAKRK